MFFIIRESPPFWGRTQLISGMKPKDWSSEDIRPKPTVGARSNLLTPPEESLWILLKNSVWVPKLKMKRLKPPSFLLVVCSVFGRTGLFFIRLRAEKSCAQAAVQKAPRRIKQINLKFMVKSYQISGQTAIIVRY